MCARECERVFEPLSMCLYVCTRACANAHAFCMHGGHLGVWELERQERSHRDLDER